METLAEIHGAIFGGEVTRSKESILAQELLKLNQRKLQVKDDNSKYLDNHPELRVYLDEFIAAVLTRKPNVCVNRL